MTPDELHMKRALDLARAGVGLVSPNPAVGAVVVDSAGHEVGVGTHTYAGMKHAEVLALEQARARARGGTLYLNLEPCSHQGRTGPCADAVIAAGIRRVVCSMQDPNPQVSGSGFAKLRAAGIQVDVGLLEAEAKKLNESFAKYIRTCKPFVTLKTAMTLDGKIAPPAHIDTAEQKGAQRSQWITGEIARTHVQQLRHQNDAVLVGVGTVMTDDPLLTDRTSLPRRRKLLRVILDSYLRMPPASRVILTCSDDVLVFCSAAEPAAKAALESRGIRVEELPPSKGGRPDFAAIVKRLGQMEITSLLLEGGALVNGTSLLSGEVDRIFLYFAPTILGEGAVSFTGGGALSAGAKCVTRLELHRFGQDFAVEGYLKDPYTA